MSTFLQDGMAWLADQGEAHLAVEITYTRDGVGSVVLNATLGSQLLRITDAQGNTKIERTDRDFGIRAADLVLGGVVAVPKRGDHIDVSFDGGATTERYDVMAPQGEAVWRYSDAFKKRLRVHTKLTGATPAQPAISDEDEVLILAEGQ